MKTPYRWGIIGTGGIAALQVQELQAAGMNVVAVGSRSQETADRFGDRFAIARRHADYEALVADADVDIVYVATPHPMHAANALRAIEAGKHVLVEKPFTINATEAAQVIDAAAKRGVMVMEAMWTRFLPGIQRIMELVRSGAIGTPRVLIADHNQYIPRERAARLYEPELGGGALLDLGIYPVSFADHLFGRPATITARATLSDLGVDQLTAIILEYESGAQAVLHTGFMTPGPNVASIVGTEGRIDIDAVWYTQTTFTRYDRGGTVVERYDRKIDGRGMQYQAMEVERCVTRGITDSATMPVRETLAIMRTLDEVRRQIGVVYPQER